jgi:Na+/proline symporter
MMLSAALPQESEGLAGAVAGQPVIVTVGIAYFLVVVAIGMWAARRTRTAEDFFLAGRAIGLVAMTLAAMSATFSGFAFIGGPGLFYQVGLGSFFLFISAAVSIAMTTWVLAKRMRLLADIRPVVTIPDAIGARYRSRLAHGLAAVSILVGVLGYMATNILALGIVVDAIFGIGFGWALWLGMGTVLAYATAGGILAGIYTDVFQGLLMMGASLLVFAFVLDSGGGLAAMSTTVVAADPAFLSPWGHLPPQTAFSFFLVFGLGLLGQPHVIHKFYMLRDPRRLKWFPILLTLAFFLAGLLWFGVGLAVKALTVEGAMEPLARPDDATPAFLLGFTPVTLAALVFAGVAAAIMSTVNSFVNVGAAALIRDLPTAFGMPVKNQLFRGRVATVVLCVAAALIAQFSGFLVAFLAIFGLGLFASTLVPALAVGLNWEGATRAGAVASMITGLTLTLSLEVAAFFGLYSLPQGVTTSGLTLVASLLVFFAVCGLTRESAPAALDPDIREIMRM